jgi:hypothetical protein
MQSRSLITLAAVVALAPVTGYAQSNSMRVSVPFEFTVARTVLPAGDYTVQSNSLQRVVSLQTTNRDSAASVIAIQAVRDKAQEQPTLVFNRYGSNYFLASIWWAGVTSGLELPKSKTEKELAKTASARRPEQVLLMASR